MSDQDRDREVAVRFAPNWLLLKTLHEVLQGKARHSSDILRLLHPTQQLALGACLVAKTFKDDTLAFLEFLVEEQHATAVWLLRDEAEQTIVLSEEDTAHYDEEMRADAVDGKLHILRDEGRA